MALRFGVVRIILLIAFLIVIVQLITVYHFTLKYTSQIKENTRRKVSDTNDYVVFNENVENRFPAIVDNQSLPPTDDNNIIDNNKVC